MSGTRFAGYAAVFDRPDRGGDILRKGAFDGAPLQLPLYLSHDAGRRIGTIERLAEDARGLRITGIANQPVRVGQGLSFGYRVRRAAPSACGTYRELTAVDLIEISLVAHPMQPLARVIATQDPIDLTPQKETDDGL